jgi:hypothetical protein
MLTYETRHEINSARFHMGTYTIVTCPHVMTPNARVLCMSNGKRRPNKTPEMNNRALHVLARMRRTGESLTAAARAEQIDPRTVRKYVAADLRGLQGDGPIRPTKADRRRRDMDSGPCGGTTMRGSPLVPRSRDETHCHYHTQRDGSAPAAEPRSSATI